MRNIYDNSEFFAAYAEMGRSKDGLKAAGEWHQLQPLFPKLQGKKVLDLGCGYGWHCKYAAQMGATEILGIDSSQKMIAKAVADNSDDKIKYKVCGVEEYIYPENTYDLVVSNLVLHYIENLANVYQKVYCTLKAGGYFLFNIEHPTFTAGVNEDWIYDENGKHVRTKKEILGEDGEIREGCHIVKKGEIYEKKLFTVKDERFKSNAFLDEVKRSYTDLINLYVKDENQKLQVFQRGSVYLATKKIGKRNPKAPEIEADNRKRQEWNRAVDMALISGIPEPQIMGVKQKRISEPISRKGSKPSLFAKVVTMAIEALELMIESVLVKKYKESLEQKEQLQKTDTSDMEPVISETERAEVKNKELK